MIDKLSSTAPDPTFRNSILPGACRAYACGLHAAGCQQLGDLLAKLGITIQDRVAVRTRFRKCLSQLLRYPGAGRVFRDIEMEDLASAMFDDEETVQDPEGEGRHGEEVHGRDGFAVIAKESSPALAGVVGRRQAVEIAGDGPFGDIEAEFQKLTVNSGSTPRGILVRHPSDKRSDLGINFRPAQVLWPGTQAPEQTKASPMPGDNGFRFDDDQDVAPCWPKPTEQNPKHSILGS